MPKTRLSTLDVAAECACLRRRLVGMRVANVYDLDSRTFQLKLARSAAATAERRGDAAAAEGTRPEAPGAEGAGAGAPSADAPAAPTPAADAETEKAVLLLESGVRLHSTRFVRAPPDHPSPFTLKMRKHIRGRKLEDVRQLGADRVAVLSFGAGLAACHLVLELYAGGNLVLTDHKYETLALARGGRRRPFPPHSLLLSSVPLSSLPLSSLPLSSLSSPHSPFSSISPAAAHVPGR